VRVKLTDGGRAAAGFQGLARDCVTRAIACASELPYAEVYASLNDYALRERRRRRSSARTGVFRATYERYLIEELHAKWTPTMRIGSGCKVHLRDGEIPAEGRLVVSLSRHLTAVIDGVIHDDHDPSRGGDRCVYGWYTL